MLYTLQFHLFETFFLIEKYEESFNVVDKPYIMQSQELYFRAVCIPAAGFIVLGLCRMYSFW